MGLQIFLTRRMQPMMALLVVTSLLPLACAPGPGQIGGQAPAARSAPPLTPMPTVDMLSVEGFELTSYRRMDDHVDPKGGGPVYVVDRNLTLRARVHAIKRLDVALALNARDTVATVAGVPDADGSIEVQLRLPRTGVIYVVSAVGVTTDQSGDLCCTAVNERGEHILPVTPSFRVVAEQ